MAARKRREGRPDDFLAPYLGPIFLRLRKGRMTQEELAKKAGIDDSTLSRIESGQGRIRPDVALALCTALGQDVDEVIAWAAEDLKKDYKKMSSKKAAEPRDLEKEPLRVLEDKIREKHDEHMRSERELREAFIEWIRSTIAAVRQGQ